MTEQSSHNSNCFKLPAQTEALIAFEGDQCIFYYREDKQEKIKHLSFKTLAAAFSVKGFDTGWIAPNTLRSGITGTGYAWALKYLPPVRPMYLQFEGNRKKPFALELVPPPLLLLGVGRSYYLWAIKETERIGEETRLFRAPFPNVYANGSATDDHICFGANQVTPVEAGGMEKTIELFETSPFGTTAIENKSKQFPKDVRRALQREAKKKGTKGYSLDDLVMYEAGHRLGHALQRLIR